MVTDGGPTDDYFDDCMGFKIESKEEKLNDEFSAIKENKNYVVNPRSHG